MNGIELVKCICDQTRFEMLNMLEVSKELCVNDFVVALGKEQPLISHHLKTLKNCGILKTRGDGKKVMYSIANNSLSKLISDITKTSKQIPKLCEPGCCS